jgi:hypothetical protein
MGWDVGNSHEQKACRIQVTASSLEFYKLRHPRNSFPPLYCQTVVWKSLILYSVCKVKLVTVFK